MTVNERATRRGFLKGGLAAGAASFFDFGPLSKLGGTKPPVAVVSEKNVEIPQQLMPSVKLAQRELAAMGFSVPIFVAKQYKLRTPDGKKTMTRFDSESLEKGVRRATISAVASDPLTAVTATVATWDGVHLVDFEIFEVQGTAFRSVVKATFRNDKVAGLQNYGLSDEEADGFVSLIEHLQRGYVEVQTTGTASCCSCIGGLSSLRYTICGVVSLAVCWGVPWPFGLICGLIFSYVCFIYAPSCEDKCQMCRAQCTGPLACYGCC